MKALARDRAVGIGRELKEVAERILAVRRVDQLEESLRKGCWIYGAGGYGKTIFKLLRARGVPCRGFIDQRAGEPAMEGLEVPVISPDRFSPDTARGHALIVGLHNFAVDQAPIVRWGKAAGFTEVLIPAELPDILGPEAGSYWLTGRHHTIEHLDELVQLMEVLADPLSVANVAAAARFRVTGAIEAHPAADLSDQYFPGDLPFGPEPLRVIDGGAYTGDIHAAAARSGSAIDEWYAFEPDPENFRQLVQTAAASGVRRIALFPCGLGDSCTQIRFSSGEAAGSHAAEAGGGDSVAQVVALDQVLAGIEPNFVKLDIEGFEREALEGMRATLARSQPRLAMSIYHRPEDLWELPFKIRELLPEAKLYVRQHGFNGFDTVLYAIPRS